MIFENNSFYKGLTIGVITGIVLNVIKNYIFNSKLINREIKSLNKSDKSIQSGANSTTKSKGEFKMALLVRHDLKMGKGKVAAQVSVIGSKYSLIFILAIQNNFLHLSIYILKTFLYQLLLKIHLIKLS